MSIELSIAYVDNKPTTVYETRSKMLPTVTLAEHDREYTVKVVKTNAYPLTKEIEFPEKVLHDEYTQKAFRVLYRDSLREGNIIAKEDIDYLECPELKLVILRLKLSTKRFFYIAIMRDGKFINNRLNREVLGSIILREEP